MYSCRRWRCLLSIVNTRRNTIKNIPWILANILAFNEHPWKEPKMLPILALLFFDGEDTCAVPPTEVVPAFFASPAIGIQSGQITGVIHQFSNHIECGQPLVARDLPDLGRPPANSPPPRIFPTDHRVQLHHALPLAKTHL